MVSNKVMDFSCFGQSNKNASKTNVIAVADTIIARGSWRHHSTNIRMNGGEKAQGIQNIQPWFYKTMTKEEATGLISTYGNQDVVFLVRESHSNPGSYVLTYSYSGPVIHEPIKPIIDPLYDTICLTLDRGVTIFYDLLQLVEFYQLNAGCLPARLTDYLRKS